MVRPLLYNRGLSCLSCLCRWCIVAKRLDRSRCRCVRRGIQLPNRGTASPIFGPCLYMRPNGWMDQDATCYEGGPGPRPHRARWGTSSLPKRDTATPGFSVHVYCGQTAGWIRIAFGTEKGLGPGNIVLDRDRAPLRKGHSSPYVLALVCCGQMVAYLGNC